MKRIFTYALGLAMLCSSNVWAQTPAKRTCGTDAVHQRLLQQDPGYAERVAEMEALIANHMERNKDARKAGPKAIIRIPVVVHVVYRRQVENISDAQVQSQIAVLNEDFRRLNSDSANAPINFRKVAGDSEIQFCLAAVDPLGQPTTGITRTVTTNASFNISNEGVKYTNSGGKDAWPRNQYLNIWVCNLAGGLLGYAQPPGGPAATDGVVLLYESVGRAPANPFPTPYNKGRTGTHEVGHWLGLSHIWGNSINPSCTDSDGIADTPNQLEENYGCPSGTIISCNNGPDGDMWMNFMDYTDDGCMNIFTKGQAARMNSVLDINRFTLKNSSLTNCSNSTTGLTEQLEQSALQLYPNPATQAVTLTLSQPLEVKSIVLINAVGQVVATVPAEQQTQKYELNIASLPAGVYLVQVSTGSGIITKRLSVVK